MVYERSSGHNGLDRQTITSVVHMFVTKVLVPDPVKASCMALLFWASLHYIGVI